MALSLVLGGALGAAVGVGREFFDRSLRGARGRGSAWRALPRLYSGAQPEGGLLGGVSPDKADRILDRTLQRLLVATDAMRLEPMVIAITPLENDKAQNQSFIAKAYADELAKLGHEVLLIARNPERASTAAAGALARHSARSLVAEPGSHQNPTVIPAGNLPVLSQSANRTGFQTLGSSVSGLSGRFDRVVIESTSLEQALHVSALLPSVDRFIVLARWGSIPRQSLTEAIRSVHGLRAKCSGVVLDEADLSKVV